ncbi:type IV toxin-antitoxin system AbiEi family antitoxin domain-containing protein [Rathayibacter iranicus]|uniref:DUF559 domain-containing protein n=2 Tax=Rathayibacter iranicus TaxID=59737 RepID=A0AAD1EM34_9MICO|nr:type IV toxin-antitoxin system AbiEi family antitoxin domain-containing protein [Rathayibacter iranicus]AZZ55681.1 DUF559 domain-containing protein [Rathayibacter iranicus]MWV31161.1 DUF559 domain-containing protein [Rathayibacter iranicus NCPPB 2253 = VKM Ac-1602]PPI47803.1 hypothetical protein C5E09_06160 [Rathayibacter iranicus]PPI61101.1 hypothetical protein C5E08_07090 [Rathayibacter iranicus]PPI72923.1 hypothetical protein C5E01_03560 [Rathayibacter iranicus]
MDRLWQVLLEQHGVATTAQFAASGVSVRTLQGAVREGAVLRLRRGWFALPSVSEDERRAVSLGGVLTCGSALSARGLWVLDTGRLHVAVPSHSSERRGGPGVTLHWRRFEGCGVETASLDGVRTSLLHLVSCVDGEDALMTLDSAVNSGTIPLDDLLALRPLASAGRQWVFGEIDPLCQSGLETRIRRCGRRLGVRVRTQVVIRDVGRVDVILGDRLVVEPDGRRFHSGSVQIEEDYRRSLELTAQGYLCLRLSYRQVVSSWERTEAAIAAMLARGEHLWPARRRVDRE